MAVFGTKYLYFVFDDQDKSTFVQKTISDFVFCCSVVSTGSTTCWVYFPWANKGNLAIINPLFLNVGTVPNNVNVNVNVKGL